MNASTHIPTDYLDALLSLNDDMKRRIIHLLSDSLKGKMVSHQTVTQLAHNGEATYPADICSLIGIASGVEEAAVDDERLAYLLSK
jgi:hypothetical protein